VVDTSHTGLLFSADVAHHTGRFLRQGSFAKEAATPSHIGLGPPGSSTSI